MLELDAIPDFGINKSALATKEVFGGSIVG
jgi:hypothetical protein